jgi:hypothetical protein
MGRLSELKTVHVKDVARHRNGISGAPFWVVLFSDEEYGQNMVGIAFRDRVDNNGLVQVAVLDLNETLAGNIDFAGGNSWRGDWYAPVIYKSIIESELRDDMEHDSGFGIQEHLELAKKWRVYDLIDLDTIQDAHETMERVRSAEGEEDV